MDTRLSKLQWSQAMVKVIRQVRCSETEACILNIYYTEVCSNTLIEHTPVLEIL